MGKKKNTDMSMTNTEVKVVATPVNAAQIQTGAAPVSMDTKTKTTTQTDQKTTQKPKTKKTTQKKVRSKKYQAVRAQVDKTKKYDPFSALELVKKLSYSRFAGSITAHLVLLEKFQNERVQVQLPHSTGKSLKVEIANDQTFTKIEAGEIDFDVLLATPDLMPKLAKLAKVLGPRGLMPNPKQGTLTAKPQEKKKELESGKVTLTTERKAPLMHVVIGNTKMETKQLQENLYALLNAFKGKVQNASLAATMSPAIKVAIEG